jgi:toxin ParE1/3/4
VRLRWSRRAKASVVAISDYISIDSPNAARTLIGEIQTQVDTLADHPRLGRAGRVRGTRELVINRTPYIAAYRIDGDLVTILRVLHGKQRWPKRFS